MKDLNYMIFIILFFLFCTQESEKVVSKIISRYDSGKIKVMHIYSATNKQEPIQIFKYDEAGATVYMKDGIKNIEKELLPYGKLGGFSLKR